MMDTTPTKEMMMAITCKLLILSLMLGLALTMACSGARQPTPGATPTPDTPPTPEVFGATEQPKPTSGATPTPDTPPTPEVFGAIEQPNWWGTATDSVEDRIFQSDVIVRATLVSTGDGHLRFRAVEYLKGSGATEFVVDTATAQRSTAWDGQEAVLFLATPDAGGPSGSSGDSPLARFQFAEPLNEPYKGALPVGYTVDSRNPVWLPRDQSASGASGQSGSDPTFVTDAKPLFGTGDAPTITLTDLKAKIAWIDGGEGVTGYDQCIRESLSSIAWHRDFEVFFGSPWTPPQESMEIGSGMAAGTQSTAYGTGWPLLFPEYNQYWLSGKDASLFVASIVDDDEDPSNGFRDDAFTTRPLPNGTYEFTYHSRFFSYLPCDFWSKSGRADWTLTVTAPEGTVHEAFFDPISSGDAVGYFSAGDALKPATFTTGGASTTIQSLKWQDSAVTLELSTYDALAGQTLDFITGDGTISLSLDADSATGDAAAGTLTWAVGSQPWSSGDELMLRITEPWYGVRVALSPREDGRQTFTDVTVSWSDPETCSNQYFVGLYAGGEAPVRIWGYHPATTTSVSRNTTITWDDWPIHSWTARVTCEDGWRTVGDVRLSSGLP